MGRIKKALSFFGIITGVILLLVLIYSGAYYLAGINPKVALFRYVRTEHTLDYREFSQSLAYDSKGLLGEIYKNSNYSKKELADLLKGQSDRAVSELKELYGLDYKIEVRIIETKVFDEALLQNSIAGIKSTFEYLEYDIGKIIDADRITAMIEYEYEVTIAGSRGEFTYQGAMLMAKLKGRWGALPNMF
ncbi:MAG: hypothetical protein FWG91_07250 [Lachnospiraceae bacterium]|nr:hypothetical protein [Lachnospiraceae bacterium]